MTVCASAASLIAGLARLAIGSRLTSRTVSTEPVRLDALNDLKNAKGVTVADLQTGMSEVTREALEALANEERE